MPVETFQELEHGSVLVVEEPLGNPHLVVGGYPHEILIESAMMDRAETESVRNHRLAFLLEISRDVSGVEEPRFSEPTDRAKIRIRDEHAATKACLVEANACLAHCVSSLDDVFDENCFGLVDRPCHAAGRYKHATPHDVVVDDIHRIDRLVPTGTGRYEVDERSLRLPSCSKCTVVRLIDGASAICIEETLWNDLVVVR